LIQGADFFTRKQRSLVVLLLMTALAVRVAFAVLSHIQFGDAPEYLDFANRIANGHLGPYKNDMLFVRAPGYPYFIAIVWLLTGSHSQVAVKLVQALVGTGTCFYIYRMARLIGASSAGALIALAGGAFYPYLIYYTGVVGTESLFAFFVAAGTFHLANGLSRGGLDTRQFVYAGIYYALGNMIRPNLSTVYPLLALWLCYRYRHAPKQIVSIGLALAIPLLVVTLPWSIASVHAGLGFIWVTDGGGLWYWVGHNDAVARFYCADISPQELHALSQAMPNPVYAVARELPPVAQQSAYWRDALAWDRQHLDLWPCLLSSKFIAYWRLWVNPAAYDRSHILISLASVPVLPLAGFGLVRALRRGERALSMPVVIQIVTGTAVAMIFSTEIRYRVPVVDVLLMPFFGFACVSLAALWRRPSAI